MSAFELLNTSLFKVTGWTMIHSGWQFLLLYVVLRGLLFIINKSHSNLRYFIGIGAMVGAVVFSGFTFWHEYQLYFGNEVVGFNNKIINLKTITVQNIQPTLTIANSSPSAKFTLLYYLDAVSPYLTIVWIIGILFYLLKIISGSVYLYKLRNLQSGSYPAVTQKLQLLSHKMQVDRFIKLIITNAVTEPLTFGNLKPIILLPVSYVANVPMEQLEMILAHELAHIKRYDYVVNLVQTTLEAIFFFNPFFKFISNTVRNEREYCCDDMAARYCGDEKTMAIALANLKIIKSYPQLSLAASATASVFQTRIHRLITPAYPSRVSVKTFIAALLVFSLAAISITKLVNKHRENKLLTAVIKTDNKTLADKPATASVTNNSVTPNIEPAKMTVHPPVLTNITKPLAAADTDTTHRKKPIEKTLAALDVNAESLPVRNIYYKTDTVEFRAIDYIKFAKLADDASLDKLLAQMEGFKINSAGQILFQGIKISGISFDGNILAEVKFPTNITAGMIKYVRVCNKHSEPVITTLDFELKK